MSIKKSAGVTPTKRWLAELCERTFLKLWSYPNLYKDDGKELCDLLVMFEDVAFVFFDREKPMSQDADENASIGWERWKRRVVDAQIKTAAGAARYLNSNRKIYLDSSRTVEIPIRPSRPLRAIFKIVVAHGAKEACLSNSTDNIYGSLAIAYCKEETQVPSMPFMLSLASEAPTHVLDSHNLPILLSELDTIWDFTDYLEAKEEAIGRYYALQYCGEEDLLAHYFMNYDKINGRHRVGVPDPDVNFVAIGEREWSDFVDSPTYKSTKAANAISYSWDELIQITAINALSGKLLGASPLEHGKSAIHEMAKEPRFSRRALAEAMYNAIDKFPENITGIARHACLMPSFYAHTRYVFLQIKAPDEIYRDGNYRRTRQYLLEVACGAAKNANPEIDLVVGIAIDAPKFHEENSEDFILMDCAEWSTDMRNHYENANAELKFFNSGGVQTKKTVSRFVPPTSD